MGLQEAFAQPQEATQVHKAFTIPLYSWLTVFGSGKYLDRGHEDAEKFGVCMYSETICHISLRHDCIGYDISTVDLEIFM